MQSEATFFDATVLKAAEKMPDHLMGRNTIDGLGPAVVMSTQSDMLYPYVIGAVTVDGMSRRTDLIFDRGLTGILGCPILDQAWNTMHRSN